MNVHHDLQAHVSYLLSHMSEDAATQFGVVDAGMPPHGIRSGPLFSAQA
jgi:hypothetical protein